MKGDSKRRKTQFSIGNEQWKRRKVKAIDNDDVSPEQGILQSFK